MLLHEIGDVALEAGVDDRDRMWRGNPGRQMRLLENVAFIKGVECLDHQGDAQDRMAAEISDTHSPFSQQALNLQAAKFRAGSENTLSGRIRFGGGSSRGHKERIASTLAVYNGRRRKQSTV